MPVSTDTYQFRNIPVHASGKVTVARLSGVCKRHTRPDQVSYDDIYLDIEGGGMVHVMSHEPLYEVIYLALQAQEKAVEEIPISDTPYDPKKVDNAQVEGAQNASG